MAFTVKKIFPNISRHSNAARAAAEMANALSVFAFSRALTSAALAEAATGAKVKTAATLTYTVAGNFYSKNATDNFWTLSGTTVAVASWQKYLLLIDSSGAASIQEATQSPVSAAGVVWTNVSGVSSWAPFLVAVGSTKAIVGILTIATDASNTFIPGTTALDGTGITATFVNGVDSTILPLIGDQMGNVIGNGG